MSLSFDKNTFSSTSTTATILFSKATKNERFPSDVYKYMKQNVSPKILLKLMQICKYFQYLQFPYFVLHNGLNLILNQKPNYSWNKWNKYVNDYPHFKNLQELRLNELQNNLWINSMLICEECFDLVSLLIPKVAYFDIECLVLYQQNLMINEFKILTAAGKIKQIFLSSVFIEDIDNSLITMAILFSYIPTVEKISVNQNIPSIRSFEELKKTCSPNLLYLKLSHIPEDNFDISAVNKFIRWRSYVINKYQNNKSFVFDFTFNDNLSPEYTKKLQIYVDQLVDTWKYKSGHFHFIFKDCSEKAKNIMKHLCDTYTPWCERSRRKCGCYCDDDYCECSSYINFWPSIYQAEKEAYYNSFQMDEKRSLNSQNDFYDEWEIRKAEKAKQRNNTKKFVAKKKESKLNKNQTTKSQVSRKATSL